MSSEPQSVTVTILDKNYQIACPPSERDSLQRAAKELDARMRVIRSTGNVIGLERIAIMAALNLCYDLNKIGEQADQKQSVALERLLGKLDSALDG
ncbi:cell division protein ZapA [Teredinibacter turnerae]|uniref:cell division protein ZapA n=1 Tax=Teredinibacter turnerae TaxID=2426 RepID=UPI000367204B|nr:cell division protein ZapA [Teredinibacter turnerae]